MIQVASVICGGDGPDVPGCEVLRIDNTRNTLTPCQAYQEALRLTTAEILCMVHDDLMVHDADWLERFARVFVENSDCVAVGLGGAVGLGTDDLYRKPFNVWNLARQGYCSNQTDAEVHGSRETGTKRVAVLEQFCMAVRTDWLRTRKTTKPLWENLPKDCMIYVRDSNFGWPELRFNHHCLDLWLACEAACDGKELWMVGASCTHHGGGTSVTDKYAKASWLSGGTLEQDHILPHLWIFEEYRDILPIVVVDKEKG